ncbi:hypothetical protein D3C72_2280170 [compost metagenome]
MPEAPGVAGMPICPERLEIVLEHVDGHQRLVGSQYFIKPDLIGLTGDVLPIAQQ